MRLSYLFITIDHFENFHLQFKRLQITVYIYYSKIAFMRLKQFLQNTIFKMDMLKSKPTFRIKKQGRYQTIFGGIVSFIIATIFSYILYLQFYYLFNNHNIRYKKTLFESLSSKDSITDFKFALSIQNLDLSQAKNIFKFKLYKIDHYYGVFRRQSIELVPCTDQIWSNLAVQLRTQINSLNFNQMLCIKNQQNITITGFCGDNVFSILRLQISKCDDLLDSNCDNATNIENYMQTYISTHEFINVKLYVIDTIISPDKSDPITSVIEKKIFLSFSRNLGSTGFISLSKYTLTTDISPWPIQSLTSITGYFIEQFRTNEVARSRSKYITLNIFKSTKRLRIERVIAKFDSALSYVGGLFGIILGFIILLIGSYSQRKYELYVGKVFLKDHSDYNINEEDFHFITYIGYSIYNWLDVFKIAPSYLKYFKAIHQIRGQVNQQLSPTLIFKRLIYLENAFKTLINQKQQLLIRLKQPMNLNESKYKRIVFSIIEKLMIYLKTRQQNLKRHQQKLENENTLQQVNDKQIENMLKKKLLQALLSLQIKKTNNQSILQNLSPQAKKQILLFLNWKEDQPQMLMKQQLVFVDPLQISEGSQQKEIKKSYKKPKRNNKNIQ